MKIPFNEPFYPYFKHEGELAVLWGGAGSGKSHAIAQKHIMRCRNTPPERFLYIRQVFRDCRGSTFRLTTDILARHKIPHKVNKTDLTISFPNGSEILHAGLDDAHRLKSIAGITSIWIEEANEISYDSFEELSIRLRGESPAYKQITLSLNPMDIRNWVKTEVLDQQAHTYEHHSTWRDNAFVDDDYGKRLAQLTEDKRKIYERGEWGTGFKGLIYPDWDTYTLPADAFDAFGLDFGYNSPSALVGIQVMDPQIKVQEFFYETHLTTPEIIDRVTEIVPAGTPVYCDTEPDRIAEMSKAGIHAYPADKSVSLGIDTVKRYNLKLHVHSQNLMREIREYRWDENRRTGELSDEKPVKHNDHAMDAMRYAIHSHLGEAVAQWGVW